MDSTKSASPDSDKKIIHETCVKAHKAGGGVDMLNEPSAGAESYYCDRTGLRLFNAELLEYDFETPMELRTMLQQMWEHQQCGYMKEFAVVVTIAAFHNKKEESDGINAEIPSFIYNF
jgi:hypothetical protein